MTGFGRFLLGLAWVVVLILLWVFISNWTPF